jgi:hypothetical protein
MPDSTTFCQTCQDVEVNGFLSLGPQPACHFPENAAEAEKEPLYPLDLGYCPKCSLVQIMKPVDERILFSDGYHHIAGLTNSFRQHVKGLAADLAAFSPPEAGHRFAIEIGSNDGTLLDALGELGFDAMGVDPCGSVSAGGRPVVQDYFGAGLAPQLLAASGPADVVLALNTLAHITNLHDFLGGVRAILGEHGTFVTESHYLPELLDSLQYDFAYHEHSRYYSLTALEAAFQPHGLEIFRVQRIPTHGGSIRVYAGFKGAHEIDASVTDMYAYEATLELTSGTSYSDFATRTRDHRDRFHQMLKELKDSGARIAGASFPARAVTLLNYCALGPDEVDFISEISERKVGRLSPGTHIPIVPQSELCGPQQPQYALLLSWHIADELIPRLRAEGFKGSFIVPLPEPRIIT